MTQNSDAKTADKDGNPPPAPEWVEIVQRILAAFLVSSLVFLAIKILVHLISISYHRMQYDMKIKDSKRHVHVLSVLHDASTTLFPPFCPEFAEEDYLIQATPDLGSRAALSAGAKTGTATPMKLLANVGRVGDQITAAFGNIAHEVTGKEVFNPTSSHSVVVEALEKKISSEALAKRIWMSLVVEGKDALFEEDVVEVLGEHRQKEARDVFQALDKDGNGDVSLDEMILAVCETGRERKAIASSLHDVDQAINILENLLLTLAFIVCIFIFGECAVSTCYGVLTMTSGFPERVIRDDASHGRDCTTLPLFHLLGYRSGDPWLVHIPLREAPVRCGRSSRHQR